MCARMFERLVLGMQSWDKDCLVLWARCCSFVVSWLLETPDVRSLSETNHCGTVNVLDAADTDWDSRRRVIKYARRVPIFFYIRCQNFVLNNVLCKRIGKTSLINLEVSCERK